MNLDKSVTVSVAIGGAQTTVALISSRGEIHHRSQAKTLRGRPAAATLEPYLRAIDTALSYARARGFSVYGIGVSVPGTLDETARRLIQIPQLPSLSGFPLHDLLATRFRLPTQLYVDIDAALLGELHFGAGKDFRRLLFLTIHAVVGAAFMVDGQLEHSTQYVGHVCHLPIATSTNSMRCSCGKRGCINTLVSMNAVQRMVQRALRRGDETGLTQRLLNRECLSPQLLAEEADRGDSVALHIYSEIGRWLGVALEKYISFFEPDILILGGNTFYSNDLLFTHLRSRLDDRASSRVCSMVAVVPASLGNDAALIGATSAFR